MTIETKYNIGDTVFTLLNDSVKQAKVSRVGVSDYEGNVNYPLEDYIKYVLKTEFGELNNGKAISQGLVFPTKEELLKSL